MNDLYHILLRNEGQVLTPELIEGIIARLRLDDVSAAGFIEVPDPYAPPEGHHESLVFADSEGVGAWVAEQVGQEGGWGPFYAMGICRDNGEYVAGIVFNQFNGVNATCHIAVKRISKQFIELLKHGSRYAYEQCGLKRLTGLVESGNAKALRLDRKIGFEPEAVLSQAGREGQDIVVMVMWADKCPWLENNQ